MARKHRELSEASQEQSSTTRFSREDSVSRYSQTRRSRTRRQRLRICLAVVAAVVLCTAGIALAYAGNISSKLTAGIDAALRGQLTTTEAGEPFYMLLMGVDKSQDRAESDEYGEDDSNYRTDSIILARIDPKDKKVALVSIHRDTLVDFGAYGKQKINAAYSLGASMENSSGPAYTVETISKFAGVPISHYAEIDFDSFTSVVDQLGGIEVNVGIDMDDDMADAHLSAGWQTLNGQQALALCRSRHSYDDYGDGDMFRASNQRMVIGAILQKILASDPATIASTVSTLADSVTTDMSLTDILGLATQFRGFNMDSDLMSGMEPTNSKVIDGIWYEICDTKAWKTMMMRVNQGLSPYEDESQDVTKGLAGAGTAIKNDDGSGDGSNVSGDSAESEPLTSEGDYSGTVEVLNGAGVQGLAGRVASTLDDYGFDAFSGTADSFDYSTSRVLYVGEENKARASAVAETLGLDAIHADDGTYAGEACVVVVLGEDMADL